MAKDILQLINEYESDTAPQPTPKSTPRKLPPRTDRNNNPIAVIHDPLFTKHVSVPVSKGDKFPTKEGGSRYHTARFNTPEEGMVASKEILSNSPEAISWYKGHTGSDILSQYNIQSPEDFAELPEEDQYA